MRNLLSALLLPLLVSSFKPLHHNRGIKIHKTALTEEPAKLRGLALMFSALLVLTPAPSFAADYANMDVSGQDFSGKSLALKDFSGVIAKHTNFHSSDLQGCNFSNANLVGADFSGTDIRGASFQDSVLDGTTFKNANARKAMFSATILDIRDLENIDLTDSMWPSKLQIMICDMDELKGTNPVTGVDSRASILCEE